jgi:hypothetical protein
MATSGYRTEKQKMLAGELYCARDTELQADQRAAEAWWSGTTRRLIYLRVRDTCFYANN